MKGSLPLRWLDYKPVGDVVPGTRFIAFKVPLTNGNKPNIPAGHRLSPSLLMQRVPLLGMVIDLTNTARYYSPRDFQDNCIEHRKILVPGHKVPKNSEIDKFNMIATEFLYSNQDNERLIGVHCTHGINRAGFFICQFMVTRMNFDPKDAIKKFGLARGHSIERQNYIEAIYKMAPYNNTLEIVEQKMETQFKPRSRTRSKERNKMVAPKLRSTTKSRSVSRESCGTRKTYNHLYDLPRSPYRNRLYSDSKANSHLDSRLKDIASTRRTINKRRSSSRGNSRSRRSKTPLTTSIFRYHDDSCAPAYRYKNNSRIESRSSYKPSLKDNGHSRYESRLMEQWNWRDKSHSNYRNKSYLNEERTKRSNSPLNWRRDNYVGDYNRSSHFNNFQNNNVEVVAIRPHFKSRSSSRRRSRTRSKERSYGSSKYDSRNDTLRISPQRPNTSRSSYSGNYRRNTDNYIPHYNRQNTRYKWDRRLDSRCNSTNQVAKSPATAPVGSNNIEPVSFMAQRYGDRFKKRFSDH